MNQQQQQLPPAGMDYPQRPQFFAYHYLRQLLASGAVQVVGTEAFALLTTIVLTEDQLRYCRAPCFWNMQLAELFGWSEDKLDRVRKKLTTAGLLHYDRDCSRKQAFYWVLTAAWLVSPPTSPDSPQMRTIEDIPRTHAGDHAGNSAECPAGNSAGNSAGRTAEPPIPSPSPIPNPTPPPPSNSGGEWATVEGEMFRQGIQETTKPLASLQSNQVPPTLALDVLRYASETGAWEPAKVRRRLINLRSGDNPRDLHGWMKPDRPERLTAHPALPSASVAADQRQCEARYRQLELFEHQVAGRTPQAIADAFPIPEPIRNRLVQYESWERIQQRNTSLRYAVLEAIAQSVSEN